MIVNCALAHFSLYIYFATPSINLKTWFNISISNGKSPEFEYDYMVENNKAGSKVALNSGLPGLGREHPDHGVDVLKFDY